MQTHLSIRALLKRITFPGFTFGLKADNDGRSHLRVEVRGGTCNVTGQPHDWNGRWWTLSPHMTDGEVIQTAFKAGLTAMEHEVRETFKVDGVALFQPHFDLDRLIAFAADPANTKERDNHA